MFDFRRATVFCLRYCLLKHKMTRYSKNVEGPWSPSLPGYAYVRAVYITYLISCFIWVRLGFLWAKDEPAADSERSLESFQ